MTAAGIPPPQSSALVSIVIPVFNGARYITEAIESVLAQSYDPIEIVVVDDGSTDATGEEVARFGDQLVYLQQANAGTGAARNAGVRRARGELLGFLDADDRLRPAAVERLAGRLSEDTALEMAVGQVAEFVSPDLAPAAAALLQVRDEAQVARSPGTMLVRREAFERVGPWSETLAVEVVDWFARADEAGIRYAAVPHLVLERRLHDRNKTLVGASPRDYLRVVQQALRRRAGDSAPS